jgi:hypothetical protein
VALCFELKDDIDTTLERFNDAKAGRQPKPFTKSAGGAAAAAATAAPVEPSASTASAGPDLLDMAAAEPTPPVA